MKKIYFLLIALCFFATTKAQIVNIPDANFKARLLESTSIPSSTTNGYYVAKDLAGNYFKIDANNDGEIQESEALQVSYLYVSSVFGSKISSFIGILSFNNLTYLNCDYNSLKTLDVSGLKKLQVLECSNNFELTSLNVHGLTNLITLTCIYNYLTVLDLSGLTNLKALYCSSSHISSLNINGLTNLEYLDCSQNQISSLDISGLTNIKDLYCFENQIISLDAGGLLNLQRILCFNNQLTFLNVNGLTNLDQLACAQNKLSELNLNRLTNLKGLSCNNNRLSSLEVNSLINLEALECSDNKLAALDTNGLIKLNYLKCSNNQLSSLLIKNGILGTPETVLEFYNNQNLRYICTDDFQLERVQNLIKYGFPNCQVNTYCSFIPGGIFYTIAGTNKWDLNNNGCDISDPIFPNLYLKETNLKGDIIGSYISNSTGNYSISVQAGTHTITPVFENSIYFTISPTTANVTFPTQASPFTQNFCITPNGVHPDLEITLLPLRPAVPGFDAKYKIVYKNKGNTTQSGSVNLNFNDAVLDLVIANPTTTTQTTNNLSWNFSNLLPFETCEITFTINVNSPTETPAVNNGDILAYNASITSATTDETPTDNTFVFNQIVVNSFDPNDKTCLEGITISPSLIGQYVHYMIRFENNGTANAQNIVVKDMIDLSKFDISTLVPTNASHSFVTNITAGNKVEFIFENINLPFDDANNDGYIAFKIKTLPTLKVGDTFTNDASIYFDYNFPIVTKLASSTFKTLGTQDFEFANYFTLYPNPAKEVLNIIAKETIEVQSMYVYNTLGQLVLVISNADKVSKIDVSSLTAGNYFIKINSDKGSSNARFVKE
jgi:Leucine-rich repeat (LRR) protein